MYSAVVRNEAATDLLMFGSSKVLRKRGFSMDSSGYWRVNLIDAISMYYLIVFTWVRPKMMSLPVSCTLSCLNSGV